MSLDFPDDFGERNHPDPSESIDANEFHSLFEWDQGDNWRKNIGYCPLSGKLFHDVRPGERCPIHPTRHDLERLPDEQED